MFLRIFILNQKQFLCQWAFSNELPILIQLYIRDMVQFIMKDSDVQQRNDINILLKEMLQMLLRTEMLAHWSKLFSWCLQIFDAFKAIHNFFHHNPSKLSLDTLWWLISGFAKRNFQKQPWCKKHKIMSVQLDETVYYIHYAHEYQISKYLLKNSCTRTFLNATGGNTNLIDRIHLFLLCNVYFHELLCWYYWV